MEGHICLNTVMHKPEVVKRRTSKRPILECEHLAMVWADIEQLGNFGCKEWVKLAEGNFPVSTETTVLKSPPEAES